MGRRLWKREAVGMVAGNREVLREERAEVLASDEPWRAARAVACREEFRQTRDAAGKVRNDESLR